MLAANQRGLIYEPENAGWASAHISDGSHRLSLRVSHLSDALGDMAKAAAMLLNGSREESFLFQDEPGQHRFVLTRNGADALTIRALWFEHAFSGRADQFGTEVFRRNCEVLDFVGQVFANLRAILEKHGIDGYKRAFRHWDFPTRAYDEIRRLLCPSDEISNA